MSLHLGRWFVPDSFSQSHGTAYGMFALRNSDQVVLAGAQIIGYLHKLNKDGTSNADDALAQKDCELICAQSDVIADFRQAVFWAKIVPAECRGFLEPEPASSTASGGAAGEAETGAITSAEDGKDKDKGKWKGKGNVEMKRPAASVTLVSRAQVAAAAVATAAPVTQEQASRKKVQRLDQSVFDVFYTVGVFLQNVPGIRGCSASGAASALRRTLLSGGSMPKMRPASSCSASSSPHWRCFWLSAIGVFAAGRMGSSTPTSWFRPSGVRIRPSSSRPKKRAKRSDRASKGSRWRVCRTSATAKGYSARGSERTSLRACELRTCAARAEPVLPPVARVLHLRAAMLRFRFQFAPLRPSWSAVFRAFPKAVPLMAATRLLRVWLVVPLVLRSTLYQHSAVRMPSLGLLPFFHDKTRWAFVC